MRYLFLFFLTILTLSHSINCQVSTIYPLIETDSVIPYGDYADDAVVWIHPNNPELSFIIGTDKSENGRLEYFDSDGTRFGYSEDLSKSFNNITISYGYLLNGLVLDIVAASNRTDNKVQFFIVDSKQRSLIDISGNTQLEFEPYGIALFQDRQTNRFYCFVSQRYSPLNTVQYEITESSGLLNLTLVRTLTGLSLTEGMCVDEQAGYLYLCEEDIAIWKYNALPERGQDREMVDYVGSENIQSADLEGITIYHLSDSTGYLIVSLQSENTFNIYFREKDNTFLGKFTLGATSSIDVTSQTDGIFASSAAFTSLFPGGVFIAHDGSGEFGYTNYKLASWTDIAEALNLKSNPGFNPRKYNSSGMYTISDTKIYLYPNPFNKEFSIDLGEKYKSVNLTITGILGKIVYSNSYRNKNRIGIKLNTPPGIYLITLQTETKKIFKIKGYCY